MTNVCGIFIFRRDLRIDDNLALYLLSKKCNVIVPIFILDENQIMINNKNRHYFSNNAVQFICESLIDLNNKLIKHNSHLHLFLGKPEKILDILCNKMYKTYNKIIIGFNTDFSNYAIKRDNKIKEIIKSYMTISSVPCNIGYIESDSDLTLRPLNELIKEDGNAFKQFGAFYKNSIKNEPLKPFKLKFNNFVEIKIPDEYDIKDLHKLYIDNPLLAQHGGRNECIKKLKNISKFKDYNESRDKLSYTTTNLSAGLNMGCVSIREVYWIIRKKLTNKSIILKQLYWRDFYLCAFNYLPNAKSYKVCIDPRYELIKWSNTSNKETKDYWKKLIDGKTGFLMVDAGMNEMIKTGFLHNRCRMIIGVFWTKYLQIHIHDQKYGSQCGFSKYLVDAIGPSQNKMNHHWVLDFDYPGKKFSAPNAPLSGRPMNISNKMIKKWDPECIYIKRWLPHLSKLSNKEIYNWTGEINKKLSSIHPGPIFDPQIQYQKWIKACHGIK